MEDIHKEIALLLQQAGIEKDNINWGTQAAIVVAILLICLIVTQVFRHVVIPMVQKITERTKATWDDYLFNEKMMNSFARMITPIMLYLLLPIAFDSMPHLLDLLLKACLIYLVIVTLLLISSFLDSLYDISNEHESLRNRPLKGIYQMIKLVTFVVGAILILSILINQNAATILAGLGASAAVLMLIFKDTILGLVAGVQLSANDMLRPGDWITMDKYGANGYVLEVSLTTVKVQNFDKTITTIPPYALVSDSFQNWRGMRESGGRRIKRWVNIDINTIRFCTPEELKQLAEKGRTKNRYSSDEPPVVNLQVFRDYLCSYLKSNPHINHGQMMMVRQLQPTAEGLPLEVYCFTATTEWLEYEKVQNELFDHLIAVLPDFGLRIFQRPAGTDLHLPANS